MLRYLSVLALFMATGCATRQSEPLSAQDPPPDTSVVMLKDETANAYPEHSAHAVPSRLKLIKEELLNRTPSLYQNLQELREEDIFEARIMNNKDTLLSLPQGTRLLIPAHAFRTEDGDVTVVDIQVQESYSLVDIISGNLTTTTEDNMLETGGMIHIAAWSNEKECVFNDGKEIEISFPVTVPKPGMQLFTGTRDSLNRIIWTPSTARVTELEGADDIFVTVEEPPEFPGGYQALMKHIRSNLKYPADARRLCIEGAVFVQFVVDKSGNVINPSVLRGLHKSLDQSALDAISTLPKWKPGRMEGKPVNVRMVFPIRFRLGGSDLSMASDAPNPYINEQVRSFGENMTDSTLKRSAADEVSYYILSTAKLGWINCDRFIDAEDRVTFKVYIADATGGDVDVKLIFKNIRSILPGDRTGNFFYFRNVPKNEQAELLALRASNSGLEMTNKKVTMRSNNTDSLLSFQPVTVAELKGYLKALGND